jgi:hypothetical protein
MCQQGQGQGMLSIGNKCFYKQRGIVCEIVGQNGRDTWVIRRNDKPDWAEQVFKDDVEPLASDIFEVGDKVYSKHTFRGTVTGFEPGTNRVICVSEGTNPVTERTNRWSYKTDELMIQPKKIPLRLMKQYAVTAVRSSYGISVTAMEHHSDRNSVVLYRNDNGTIYIHKIPGRTR